MTEKVTLLSVNIDWESLAKEAINECPKIKKEREREVLYARFGILEDPKTLQAIGDKYKITRERIRQIVNNALKKVSTNCVSENAKKAILRIENTVKENGGYASFEYLANNLTDNEKGQENSLKFMASLSKNLEYLKTSNDFREGWRIRSLKQSTIKNVSDKAIDVLKEKEKVMSSDNIAKVINSKESIVNASLAASNKTMKSDNDKWGLVSWPHVNPRSIRDKSRYVMERHEKPIHYEELANKISDIGNKEVAKQSVHNELIKNSDFILVGRGIYALSDWGYEPGIVEEVIITVLIDANEPLHKDIIIERVLEKRIVKPSTIVLNLQKPKFKKVGKAIYTLN